MKKKIINAFLMATLFVSAVGTFVSCKDYEDDLYVDLMGKFDGQQSAIDGLKAQVEALENWKKNLDLCSCGFKDWLKTYQQGITQEEADKRYALADSVKAADNLINIAIDKINDAIGQPDSGKSLWDEIKALQDSIDKINGEIKDLDNTKADKDFVLDKINDLNGTIGDVKALAEQAIALAEANKCKCEGLDQVKKDVKEMHDWWLIWDSNIQQMQKDVDSLKAANLATQTYVDEVKVTLTELIEKRITELNENPVWTIGKDGMWYKNGKVTEWKAVGVDGANGADGANWTIVDGYWYRNGVKTQYKAIGEDGKDADVWTIVDGYWCLNGVKTDNKAVGKDATVWSIGEDGFWYEDGVKTDKQAVGKPGEDASVWTIGADGYWYEDGVKTNTMAKGEKGADATIWTIGDDGYWYADGVNSGVLAKGQNGTNAIQWTIGDDGYWYQDGVQTDKKATATNGTNGTDWWIGEDGYWYNDKVGKTDKLAVANVWTINPAGYWCLNGVQTDVKAIGEKGDKGQDAIQWTIGSDGYWYQDGVKTDYKAIGKDGNDGVSPTIDYETLTQQVVTLINLNNYYTTEKIDSLVGATDSIANEADSIAKQAMNEISIINNNFSNYVRIDSLSQSMINLFQTNSEFVEAVTNVLNKTYYTKSEINTLTQTINNTINIIQSDVNKLKDDAAKMVTGIVIQATQSPLAGYFNFPLDIRSTTLLMYYGHQSRFFFPSAELTEELTAMGGSITPYVHKGGAFLHDYSGNAGKVYMTVNPANASLKGKKFTLVNSQGKESAITLGTPVASDKLLTFGYDLTRGADNGFYETYATLDVNDVDKALFSVDPEKLMDYAKDAIKKRSTGSILNAAAAFIKAFDNKLPAYGVQAEWNDGTGQRKVTSQYNIAAAAIEPLAINMLDSYQGRTFNFGRGRVESLVAKLVNTIKIKVPNIDIDVDKYFYFDNVEILDGTEVKIHGKGYINGSLQQVDLVVTLSESEYDTIKQLQLAIVTTNNGSTIAIDLAGLFNALQELNELDTEWGKSIDKAKEDMIDGLDGYVAKVYDKLNVLMHKGLRAFDLMMVARNPRNGALALVSQSVNKPTHASGTITLWPTSYTMEIFAPAFKKVVAVTNVIPVNGAATAAADPAIAAQANSGENMMQVIERDKHAVLTGKPGYIYEITYAAVDYHANEVKEKFYIQF